MNDLKFLLIIGVIWALWKASEKYFTYIPKKNQTPENFFIIVRANGEDLRLVPERQRTRELCLEAILHNGKALKYVPKKLLTENFYTEAVKNDITSYTESVLRYIPERFKTDKLCLKAIKQKEKAVNYVPKAMLTQDFLLNAILVNVHVFMVIPYEMRTAELALAAVTQSEGMFQYVPEDIMSQDFCLAAVESNQKTYRYIPEHLRTIKQYFISREKYNYAFDYVPEDLKTFELCLDAVRYNGYALEHVPTHLKNHELCSAAVQKYGSALKYVPEKNKSQELCLAAVKQNGLALEFVPSAYKTPELCHAAIKNAPAGGWHKKVLEYVPEELNTPEFFEDCQQENAVARQASSKQKLKDRDVLPQDTLNSQLEKSKISREVEARKIKYLIHFTSIANLESILTSGFIPRYNLENDGTYFEFNDSERRDGRKDCTCFSIEYPNEFFMKRYNHKDLCVLRLNMEKLIKLHDGKIYYTIHNAATKMCRDILSTNPDFLSTYKAFINMFREENPDTRYPYTRFEKNIKPYLPTNHQSEVLIAGKIDKRFIDSIFFASEKQFNKFIRDMGDVTLLDKFTYICNSFYFNSRDNVEWRSR